MPQNLVLTENYNQDYARLNPEQKIAVDTIEGPVLVIAGAGTGKTQTIALRIANILKTTQTSPGSILCLTFTENAAANMRQRLLSIIGQAAYSVRIHTFHSFCNEVIQTNPEYFIFASEITAIDDLERLEIIHTLIEKLPDGAALKPWGDHFYYQREIQSRIQTLKRENISPEVMEKLIDDQEYFVTQSQSVFEQLKGFRAGKDLESKVITVVDQLLKIKNLSAPIVSLLDLNLKLYKAGNFDVGKAKNSAVNFKNELLKINENLKKAIPRQRELAQVYLAYQSELKSRGRYDFDDMILFVLNAFKTNSDLLLSYQERFQYILVDEYQDTNSAQNQIIDLLGSYFDIPNIFVVGDDDQSIFRFQGAAIENIFDFYQKYKDHIKVVALRHNYRSHQLILDTSQDVIKRNQNRITRYIENLDKTLESSDRLDHDPINLYAAPSYLAEDYWVIKKIKSLVASGVKPSEIAVLYRNNADADSLINLLSLENIDYHLESGSNVLENPNIRQLITLLSYIANPEDDQLLYRLLSYPFLKINPVDLFRLTRFAYLKKVPLSHLICDPETLDSLHPALKKITKIRLKNFCIRLAKARRWLQVYSLDKFFNKIIRRFKFLDYLVTLGDVEEINCLNEFYSELKRLASDSSFSLENFLNRINLLIENNLSLPLPPINGDYSSAVNLMTVHKAKGLEFDHVFIFRCLDKKWGNNVVTTALPLPMGILRTEVSLLTISDENEEERRLFYVALTRAKKQIYLSYPTHTNTNRELLPSMFISEIDPQRLELVKPDPGITKEALLALFPPQQTSPVKGRELRQFLGHFLKTDYKFNVTHLNSYLKCPFCFYYQTILRIPASKDKFASLGTAVHAALSQLFNQLKTDNKLITKEEFLGVFEKYLKRENLSRANFEEALKKGRDELSGYYDHYHDSFNCNCLLDYDFASDHVFLDNIPLTGKIDKVEILQTKTGLIPNVNVVDFKTGNPDSKGSEMKLGSDYFRQLIFYKILSDLDPHFKYHVSSGTIDFVQKSKRSDNYVKKEYQISDSDQEIVRELIKDVYQKILNLEFPISPDCDDRSDLHRLFLGDKK